jgi:hypothetical protein
MGRSKKQKEDGMKSRKVEDKIENVGRTRGIWMAKLRNIEADEESFKPIDVARGTSTEGAPDQETSSDRRDRGDKGGRDAGHLRPQFMIAIKIHDIGNISRTEGMIIVRN